VSTALALPGLPAVVPGVAVCGARSLRAAIRKVTAWHAHRSALIQGDARQPYKRIHNKLLCHVAWAASHRTLPFEVFRATPLNCDASKFETPINATAHARCSAVCAICSSTRFFAACTSSRRTGSKAPEPAQQSPDVVNKRGHGGVSELRINSVKALL